MRINQFVNITPRVTELGEILTQDTNGEFTVNSGVYLKENELGVCKNSYGDSIIVIMSYNNGELTPQKIGENDKYKHIIELDPFGSFICDLPTSGNITITEVNITTGPEYDSDVSSDKIGVEFEADHTIDICISKNDLGKTCKYNINEHFTSPVTVRLITYVIESDGPFVTYADIRRGAPVQVEISYITN